MKRLFSFCAILTIIFVSNCSRIPENNDPVIGKWIKADTEITSQNSKTKNEWIFNDVYLGRFHSYQNERLEVITDFQWEEEDGVYTISYPGLENKTNDIVKITDSEDGILLKNMEGKILAYRQN